MARRRKHNSHSGTHGDQERPGRQQDTETDTYIRYGPKPQTWAAGMPPYCFTELCPDPGLRGQGGNKGGK